MFCLTVGTVDALYTAEKAWIEDRNNPGGPLASLMESQSDWLHTFSSVCIILADALNNGLMLQRCYLVWSYSIWIVSIPFLIALTSFVMSLLMTVQSASPDTTIYKGAALRDGVVWIALTTVFNVLITGAICLRLILTCRQYRDILPAESIKTYTSVMSVMVESSFPFSAISLVYIGLLAANSPVEGTFSGIWANACVLSPMLIILKICKGSAWPRSAMSNVTLTTMIPGGLTTPGHTLMTCQEQELNLEHMRTLHSQV